MLGIAKMIILPNPDKYEVQAAAKFISVIDAPILASSLTHSDYLITLDNEFLSDKILEFAGKQSLIILKPKEFIEKFRN
jgi:hypothetical protein